MKRSLLLLLLFPQYVFSQYNSSIFNLDLEKTISYSIDNKDKITENILIPLNLNNAISGFSLSGIVTLLNNDSSYARVLLRDTYNYEHLVYECHPLLVDSLYIRFRVSW